MIVNEIKKIKDLGLYRTLVMKGVIPIKINYYLEMYNFYQIRLTVNEPFVDTIVRSKKETAEAFNCSGMTVHRAIRFMTS